MENTDLFSEILNLEINEQTTIPEEDITFCKGLQEDLIITLSELTSWYDKLKEYADKMKDEYNIDWRNDGTVFGYRKSFTDISLRKSFVFEPFKTISEIAAKYEAACRFMANEIIRHFNKKYSIQMETHDKESEEFNIVTRKTPKWEDTIQEILAYTGGRSFRDTAEDDLIKKFINHITFGYRNECLASLKKKTITIACALYYDSWNENRIDYQSRPKLDDIIGAMILGADGRLDGGLHSLDYFNSDYINFSRSYTLDSENIESIRFYKNRKMEIKFKDETTATKCWHRLRINTLKEEAA